MQCGAPASPSAPTPWSCRAEAADSPAEAAASSSKGGKGKGGGGGNGKGGGKQQKQQQQSTSSAEDIRALRIEKVGRRAGRPGPPAALRRQAARAWPQSRRPRQRRRAWGSLAPERRRAGFVGATACSRRLPSLPPGPRAAQLRPGAVRLPLRPHALHGGLAAAVCGLGGWAGGGGGGRGGGWARHGPQSHGEAGLSQHQGRQGHRAGGAVRRVARRQQCRCRRRRRWHSLAAGRAGGRWLVGTRSAFPVVLRFRTPVPGGAAVGRPPPSLTHGGGGPRPLCRSMWTRRAWRRPSRAALPC
jgi:hypothetical protein